MGTPRTSLLLACSGMGRARAGRLMLTKRSAELGDGLSCATAAGGVRLGVELKHDVEAGSSASPISRPQVAGAAQHGAWSALGMMGSPRKLDSNAELMPMEMEITSTL